jgi:hypothetical protein
MPRSPCAQPPLVTLFLFVVVYVRLVLDPTLGKTKKLISAVVNGYAAALAAYYVLSLHGPRRNEGPFSAVIIFVVVIPALFTLTAALILYSQTVGCFAGTAAVFLAWAYLARFAVALWIFPSLYPDMLERTVAFACFASPEILVAAVAAIPSRPRLGYVAGLIAAALAWPHFVLPRAWLVSGELVEPVEPARFRWHGLCRCETDNHSHPVPRGPEGALPCALVSSELIHQRTPSSRPDPAGAGGLHSLVRARRHALHRSETSSWGRRGNLRGLCGKARFPFSRNQHSCMARWQSVRYTGSA